VVDDANLTRYISPAPCCSNGIDQLCIMRYIGRITVHSNPFSFNAFFIQIAKVPSPGLVVLYLTTTACITTALAFSRSTTYFWLSKRQLIGVQYHFLMGVQYYFFLASGLGFCMGEPEIQKIQDSEQTRQPPQASQNTSQNSQNSDFHTTQQNRQSIQAQSYKQD